MSGTVSFTADTDTLNILADGVASERLLERCIIYKWLQFKRQPYAQEMEDYEDLRLEAASLTLFRLM